VLSSYITNQSFTGPIKCSSLSQPWPIGRTFATLTPLIEPEMVGQRLCGCGPVLGQRVLLLWGKNLDRIICDEAWILDVETQTWIQVSPLNLNLAIISTVGVLSTVKCWDLERTYTISSVMPMLRQVSSIYFTHEVDPGHCFHPASL